ncbi:MAG: hypothetical protein DSY42_09545 [Aquifex sp.]|nr:MAG: hypothetical protein DSY42_09545 [Aquifex sp.]
MDEKDLYKELGELSAKIAKLEKEVEELKSKLSKLEARIIFASGMGTAFGIVIAQLVRLVGG